MSFVGSVATTIPVLNPLEASLVSFNTNPYFIGLTMLLLNLGGRFLAMEVTKDQEKFFQSPFVRGFLIFVAVFVGTRNVFVAFWLSIVIILMLRFLLNENSTLYLFKKEGPVQKEKFQTQAGAILTPEEADIYRKLTDKLAKAQPTAETTTEEKFYNVHEVYATNMGAVSM